MSASERLKSLEPLRPEQLQPALTSLAWEDYERIKAYCDALPEIIAVVAAAERLRNDARGGLVDNPFHSRGDKLDEALAALDAKLTTKGER